VPATPATQTNAPKANYCLGWARAKGSGRKEYCLGAKSRLLLCNRHRPQRQMSTAPRMFNAGNLVGPLFIARERRGRLAHTTMSFAGAKTSHTALPIQVRRFIYKVAPP
jgi:hypothetical protein